MKRRAFIAGLGSAAAWPLVARGQQQAMPVIGLLAMGAEIVSEKTSREAFLQGLNEAGFVVGRNVAIEPRSAEGQVDRLPALATDLVQRKVSVIHGSLLAALAAKAATNATPIVFLTNSDPVAAGAII